MSISKLGLLVCLISVPTIGRKNFELSSIFYIEGSGDTFCLKFLIFILFFIGLTNLTMWQPIPLVFFDFTWEEFPSEV